MISSLKHFAALATLFAATSVMAQPATTADCSYCTDVYGLQSVFVQFYGVPTDSPDFKNSPCEKGFLDSLSSKCIVPPEGFTCDRVGTDLETRFLVADSDDMSCVRGAINVSQNGLENIVCISQGPCPSS